MQSNEKFGPHDLVSHLKLSTLYKGEVGIRLFFFRRLVCLFSMHRTGPFGQVGSIDPTQVDKRRRLTAPPDCPLKMTKRQGQELAIDVMKRRRIVPEQVPVLKVPPSTWGTDIQELSMPSDILPFRPMSAPSGLVNTNHCVQLLLSGAAGLKQATCRGSGNIFLDPIQNGPVL